MMLTKPLVLAAAAVLALSGCSSSPTATEPAESPATEPPILAAYDLAGLEGRQIVDQLERTPVDARQSDLMASVRPGELLLWENGSDDKTVVDLPDDEFYLSVAPYVEQTHDCYFHSLTTCRGELAGEEVHVTITDRDTGEVLVDEVTETFDNGFVGFWLPSGVDATIRVEYEGYSASEDISTGPDDLTCLTTMQLAVAGAPDM
jgi:hypothetical protein